MAVPPILRKRPDRRPNKKPALPENGLTERLPGPKDDLAVRGPTASELKKRLRQGSEAERNAEIRRRYADGEISLVLEEDYGLTKERISNICKGLKHEHEEAKKKRLEQRNAEIRRSYAQGETGAKLALAFRLRRDTIYRICKGVKK